jgi:hypothetical protein
MQGMLILKWMLEEQEVIHLVQGIVQQWTLVKETISRRVPQWEGKSCTDRASVSSCNYASRSYYTRRKVYQGSTSCLFVHSSKCNAINSISLVYFRSSYISHEYHSRNIGRSCYGSQINTPKGPEKKLMDYVSLSKLFLFISAYTISIQVLPYICRHPTQDMLSIEEVFRVSMVAKAMPKFSKTDASHL